MKKHKQSLFTKKFNNFNSQDNCDDIHWSSSGSSDCENKSNTLNNSFSNSRKRKRKKKVNQNLSNLNIIEVSRNDKISDQMTNELNSEKDITQSSPILCFKSKKQPPVSPVLKSRCLKFKNEVGLLSPIISKVQKNENELSPLLEPRISTQITPNVKKKLFLEANENRCDQKFINHILDNTTSKLHVKNITDVNISETNECNGNPKSKLELMRRVQSYFDNQFSSQSLSQQSISECESTPQNISKSSEEIEITNIITQVKDVQTNQQNSFHSSCENTEKTKKKYKKDGLAYRLAGLIKKQNSNICLWQHEKFLATNSNFIIPTCEHWVFRIQNVQFKYGCYLIEAKDLKDEKYILLINLNNINCNIIAPNYIIKLYKPYNLLVIDNFRVIVNVCKFECLPLL